MANLQSQFNQAKEAAQNGYKLLAESLLDDVVKDNPGNQEAWLLLAKVSNPKKAEECLRQAAEVAAGQPASVQEAPAAGAVSQAGPPVAQAAAETQPPPAAAGASTAKPPGLPDLSAEMKSMGIPLGAAVSLFEQAQAAARSGDKNWAIVLLKDFLKQEPKNDQAWLLLAQVVSSPQEAAYCLRHALEIRPGNLDASQRLAEIVAQIGGGDPIPPLRQAAHKVESDLIPPLREAARQASGKLRRDRVTNFLKKYWSALLVLVVVLFVVNLGWLAFLLVVIVAMYFLLPNNRV